MNFKIAKLIANKYNYVYVDTGAMYRAVALFALQNGLIDEKGKLKADAINEVEKLVTKFRKGEGFHFKRIWALIVFGMWHKKYIEI